MLSEVISNPNIIIGAAVALVVIGYIIYVLITPNSKNLSDHFRGDDEKYE